MRCHFHSIFTTSWWLLNLATEMAQIRAQKILLCCCCCLKVYHFRKKLDSHYQTGLSFRIVFSFFALESSLEFLARYLTISTRIFNRNIKFGYHKSVEKFRVPVTPLIKDHIWQHRTWKKFINIETLKLKTWNRHRG